MRRLRCLSGIERVAGELGALDLPIFRIVLSLVQPAVTRRRPLVSEAMTDTRHAWLIDEDIICVGCVLVGSAHVVVCLGAAAYDSHLHLTILGRYCFVLLHSCVAHASACRAGQDRATCARADCACARWALLQGCRNKFVVLHCLTVQEA